MGQEADYNKAVAEDQKEAQYVFNRLCDANREGLIMEVLQEFYYEIRNTQSTYRQKIDAACWEWDI